MCSFALRCSNLVICSCSLTSLMYMSTASLFHLPRSLISSRDKPEVAAETAAPLRNEWPEKCVAWIPACRRSSFVLSTRKVRLNGPSVRVKSGSVGSHGCFWNKVVRALTAQSGEWV